MPLYIQYGCGLSCPEGWINFDSSLRLRIENAPVASQVLNLAKARLFPPGAVFGDIAEGLPVAAGSCDGVYCSHVLEHLDRASVTRALANTFTMLKPGGTFRLVVPDLVWRAEEYLEAHGRGVPGAADAFMRSTYLGAERPSSGIGGRIRAAFGNSAHRWMYDYAQLSHLLTDAGFAQVRRCQFGDAEDPMFSRVEDEGRFFDSGHMELAIEARRPAIG